MPGQISSDVRMPSARAFFATRRYRRYAAFRARRFERTAAADLDSRQTAETRVDGEGQSLPRAIPKLGHRPRTDDRVVKRIQRLTRQGEIRPGEIARPPPEAGGGVPSVPAELPTSDCLRQSYRRYTLFCPTVNMVHSLQASHALARHSHQVPREMDVRVLVDNSGSNTAQLCGK